MTLNLTRFHTFTYLTIAIDPVKYDFGLIMICEKKNKKVTLVA